VLEVIRDAKKTPPTHDVNWQAKVVEPALALNKTIEDVSRGWGLGIGGITAGMWALALCTFTDALNEPFTMGFDRVTGKPPGTAKATLLIITVIEMLIPLTVAWDLAAISTRCDSLMSTLNDVRLEHGEKCHMRILWLETCLKEQNGGQGLGFTEINSGIVLNTTTLKKTAMTILTIMSTVAAFLVDLGDTVAADTMPTDGTCMLNIAQQEAMTKVIEQHAAVQLLQAFNSSCAYNVTISAAGVDTV
jgi:hypothetical protein